MHRTRSTRSEDCCRLSQRGRWSFNRYRLSVYRTRDSFRQNDIVRLQRAAQNLFKADSRVRVRHKRLNYGGLRVDEIALQLDDVVRDGRTQLKLLVLALI